MRPPQILVVEDDPSMRNTCLQLFARAGYQTADAANATEALAWLRQNDGSCIVLTDVRMPGIDGLELLDAIRTDRPDVDVVVMTAYANVAQAVEAMKRGAADYVPKPFNRDELLMTIERVCRLRGLQSRVDQLVEGLEERYRFENFIASSPVMQDVIRHMGSAARSTANVLLTGESGTGKDLVARSIHFAGPRASAPFVPVNCAGLPGELIESELFGHVRGAYTGAVNSHEGLIRRAHGGTLLLDEISEMPVPTQAKLLRVLQDKRVRPVGGTEEAKVDVRLIAATNRDLRECLASGRLRDDLYYRISVLHIHLPPLRERPEDLVPLLRHFLDESNRSLLYEQRIEHIEPEAIDRLIAHSWPGNVRELANLVERCFALGITGTLKAADIERELRSYPSLESLASTAPAGRSLQGSPTNTEAVASAPAEEDGVQPLANLERQAIAQALAETGNNKAAAARLLGIARKTLYHKIRRYGLGG